MASLTPDPKKRSFLLPPGCKDLSDLFKPADRLTKNAGLALQRQWEADQIRKKWVKNDGALCDLTRFITVLSESRSLFSSLHLTIPDEKLSVDMFRGAGQDIHVHLFVQMGTDLENAVRAFFVRHHLQLPVETAMPSWFMPNLPVHQRYQILPLSPDVQDITRIVTAYFREVAGLDDNSKVRFRYDGTM